MTSHLSLLSCIFDRIQLIKDLTIKSNNKKKRPHLTWLEQSGPVETWNSFTTLASKFSLSWQTEKIRDREGCGGGGLFCFCSHLWCRSGLAAIVHVCVCNTLCWRVPVSFWMTLIAPLCLLKWAIKPKLHMIWTDLLEQRFISTPNRQTDALKFKEQSV